MATGGDGFDDESLFGCPESHPHELFSDLWPGTTQACDCLLSGKDRDYDLDIECDQERYKKSDDEPMKECYMVGAIHPVFLNKINGLRICGARSKGMTLKERQRPIKASDTGTYSCPEGTKACEESLMSSEQLVEYAVCIPENEDEEQSCPITSFAFTL